MSDIVIRFRDSYSVGQQIAAFGYRPAWNQQYMIGVLSRQVRCIDLKSGTILASATLPYTAITAAVIPAIPGSIAQTPYNPSGTVFYLAITASDGTIRYYDRTTLALVTTQTQKAGTQGILYASRAGIVFDGPSTGQIIIYNQQTQVVLAASLVPRGTLKTALWVPTSTSPEIHYIFDNDGRGTILTYDPVAKWNWYGSFSGAGLVNILRVWTDGSQSWPYYGLPTQMKVVSQIPLHGGSVATYSLTDPYTPTYVSSSTTETPYVLNDMAGGSDTARSATDDINGQFPLIQEWHPMKTVVPADPGPDAISLGMTIHSDQGEWYLLGNNSYTPFFQYRTLTYDTGTSPNGDTKQYHVTPVFVNQTTVPTNIVAQTWLLRIRGQTELVTSMVGGTVIAGTNGYCFQNPTSFASTHDRLRMIITHSDTTTTTYFFNGSTLTSIPNNFFFLDYVVSVPILPGDSIFLEYNTVDGISRLAYQNQVNYLPADDDPGHPYNVFPPDQPLLGAALQVDVISIR